MTEMAPEDTKKEELRQKIEYRVACEEKAFRIVEKLIENPVDEVYFLESGQYITPEHYHDIIEERAVSRLCGYPLCPSLLGPIPKQKYAISTKTNKVYDIEARKNFCSGKCYRASNHFEKQISTVPVWTRKDQPRQTFSLLPLESIRGQMGDEVVVSNRNALTKEVQQLDKIDHYQQALQKCLHGDGQGRRTKNRPDKLQDHEESSSEENDENGIDADRGQCVYTLEKAMGEMGIESDKKAAETVRNEKKKKSTKPPPSSESKTDYLMRLLDKRKSLLSKMVDLQNVSSEPVTTTGKSVTENSSSESVPDPVVMTSDVGSEVKVVKERVSGAPKVTFVSEDTSETEKASHAAQTEVTDTDTKLKTRETDTEVSDSQSTHGSVKQAQKTKPPPTLELICQGVKAWITTESLEYIQQVTNIEKVLKPSNYEEKYKALVDAVNAQEKDFGDLLGEEKMADDTEETPSGRLPHFDVLKEETEEMTVKVKEFLKGSFTYKKEKKEEVQGQKDPDVRDRGDIILPTVDKYNVMLIRQKLVLDKISKTLPDLLSPLRLLLQDVYTELKELVMTFNLTSENILFKPAEWIFITLLLLKLLSRKMKRVEEAFRQPSAEMYVNILLKGIGQTPEQLETILGQLLKQQKSKRRI